MSWNDNEEINVSSSLFRIPSITRKYLIGFPGNKISSNCGLFFLKITIYFITIETFQHHAKLYSCRSLSRSLCKHIDVELKSRYPFMCFWFLDSLAYFA